MLRWTPSIEADMKKNWPLFVASRYFQAKRRDRGFAPAILSVAGIAVGVMTLVSVLAVMNGFQVGFIEDILEISSFHLRIETKESADYRETAEDLTSLKGVKSALPFMETQTMVSSETSGFEPCLIRGVPSSIGSLDPGLLRQLNLIKGGIWEEGKQGILIGLELANNLGVTVGDTVSLLTLAGVEFSRADPQNIVFTVTGIFKSGYYEFDRGLGFIPLGTLPEMVSGGKGPIIGVKLENRFKDRRIIENVKSALPFIEDKEITSWREFNSSFFGALRMEKLAMMVLIGLIFIVVGGNIYHSLKRSVFEKIEDISLLKSIGASTKSVQNIFIFDGVLIGFSGGVGGTLLGLLISYNINTVFRIFEIVSNGILSVVRRIASPIVAAGLEEVSIFSPRYYYMSEVPVKLPFQEVLLICMFAIVSAVVAAFVASRKVTKIKPSEVLRYE